MTKRAKKHKKPCILQGILYTIIHWFIKYKFFIKKSVIMKQMSSGYKLTNAVLLWLYLN